VKRFILALTASLLGLLFTACGQSGPLYLPGNPSTIQNVPNAPAGAEEENNEEQETNDARDD
jgi:predicted small lipoprotein YifL